MHGCASLVKLLLAVLALLSLLSSVQCTVRECIQQARKVRQHGDGTTPDSCMSCDPTMRTCPTGCQKAVHRFWDACKGICLPDGYYFDPPQTLGGCWKKVKQDLRIGVNRCGCSSATRLQSSGFVVGAVIVVVASVLVNMFRV